MSESGASPGASPVVEARVAEPVAVEPPVLDPAVGAADEGVGRRGVPRAATGYNPALDGLRALAVLAVLCFHMNALSGGYLGVDVFLVLSGFLITGLLLAERDRVGAVSLGRFYVRRAFRLLPAFGVFVAVGAVLVVAVKTRADQWDFLDNAVTSLLYVNNYYRVFRPDSGGAWFGHTWSLSLEEQFYLIWPAVLVLLCRRPAARRRLPAILGAAAVAVFAWREILIAAGVSDARIYFGLDTRADALLVGAGLAAWGWAAGFRLPAEGGTVRLHHDYGRGPELASVQAAALGTLLLLGIPVLLGFPAARRPRRPRLDPEAPPIDGPSGCEIAAQRRPRDGSTWARSAVSGADPGRPGGLPSPADGACGRDVGCAARADSGSAGAAGSV
ncbi:acyltransferase, partial [Frankia sp. AiPs1]|uniref:acyltransferase family protein n=1 Tax=Frankia sp. AiPs1 TaxID=573493 RepID=UPI002043C0EC